ncbi:MAG: glycosyltransferase family 2 protein [Desulfovibrio sp.]|jgi:glycosyltransferase involved in cell wall biosynthesis|nr:glycosyltransferase family 2 protein [Desulfovibrio sp.]
MQNEATLTRTPSPKNTGPKLSILITHYNYNKFLSSLLDNVKEQSIKNDAEIVIVDDCSDISPETIIRQQKYEDLNIVFIQNKTRLYTKDTRLVAVEAASSELVTFIDADDRFYGTSALEKHVNEMICNNVDMLHFRTLHRTRSVDDAPPAHSTWHDPFAQRLYGDEIFRIYVLNLCPGHTIWGKIIKRSIWIKCMDFAKSSQVRRYQEDFFLMSLLLSQTQSYMGSTRIGYIRNLGPAHKHSNYVKALGRMATNYYMLNELVPYFIANGVDKNIVGAFESYVNDVLKTNCLSLLNGVVQSWNLSHRLHDDEVNEILEKMHEYADNETFLRIMLTYIAM